MTAKSKELRFELERNVILFDELLMNKIFGVDK